MKKKLLAVLVGVLILSIVLVACSGNTTTNDASSNEAEETNAPAEEEDSESKENSEITIGATYQDLKNEYIKLLADVGEVKAKEMGIELLVTDGQGKAEDQISQVENFITQKVDAIILQPYDRDGCAPAVEKANEAGIPIIVLCSKVTNLDKAQAFVGSDDVIAGEISMQFIADQINGRGNIGIMRGPTGNSAEINRGIGYENILKEDPDINVIFDQPADWDRAKGMALAENWLNTGKQLDAIASQNDEMALGALMAAEAKGMKMPIIGIDAIADALKAVKEGRLAATVLQDGHTQGALSIEVAVKAAKGEQIEKLYDVPFQLITAENVDEFINK